MARKIIGDYIGTTWDDFLVLPGWEEGVEAFTPEDVNLSVDLAGVKLQLPFLTAAMRSIVDKESALSACKLGIMPVAPRGLTIEGEAEIVRYVKDNAIDVGEIESERKPTTALDTDNLGSLISKSKRTGHSHIPIVDNKANYVGMFHYKPSKHDSMDASTPVTDERVMTRPDGKASTVVRILRSSMPDEEIKRYLVDEKLRLVPVLDDVGRLDRLVFLQRQEAYKVGAAIDTHPGWEKRAEALIEAGADMIFIDTSDALKPFAKGLVVEYKTKKELIKEVRGVVEGYKNIGCRRLPPICAGNVVTPEGFRYLVDAGADVVKWGMGPGSICSTNNVLGVGAPPMWSIIEGCMERDKYFKESGVYVPNIADGGIEGTDNIAVALAAGADAIMGGKLFGCFYESAGMRLGRDRKFHTKGEIEESEIEAIRIFGEASEEALHTTGDMNRYAPPTSTSGRTSFQGVSGLVDYRGRFKPGVENYARALRETLYHVGARNLGEYRKMAVLIRLSERAKATAAPHGIQVIE